MWCLSGTEGNNQTINFLELNSDAAAAAKLYQLCPTLCDPIDGSPPGSSVPGTMWLLMTCMKTKKEEEKHMNYFTIIWNTHGSKVSDLDMTELTREKKWEQSNLQYPVHF